MPAQEGSSVSPAARRVVCPVPVTGYPAAPFMIRSVCAPQTM
ncbi:hypothetical protein ASZ90_009099 [hydrocarbon metagenome]|uniref:Uncharacterized protein n=1 Tax=hydrocarbon metagenome TaxID=938273 RepID=A0A0W8FJS3_9ZZZZ